MYGRGPHPGSSLRRVGGYPVVIGRSHLPMQGFRSQVDGAEFASIALTLAPTLPFGHGAV